MCPSLPITISLRRTDRDPLPEIIGFDTDTLHRWDPVKKVYETKPVITEFMRLLVILVSDQFDCTH